MGKSSESAGKCHDDEISDVTDGCSLVEVKESADHLASHFKLSLEAKGIPLVTLHNEVEEAVEYAQMY